MFLLFSIYFLLLGIYNEGVRILRRETRVFIKLLNTLSLIPVSINPPINSSAAFNLSNATASASASAPLFHSFLNTVPTTDDDPDDPVVEPAAVDASADTATTAAKTNAEAVAVSVTASLRTLATSTSPDDIHVSGVAALPARSRTAAARRARSFSTRRCALRAEASRPVSRRRMAERTSEWSCSRARTAERKEP